MRCEACEGTLDDDGTCASCATPASRARRAAWLRAAALRAVRLARVYRREEGPRGRRELEALAEARTCRERAKELGARGPFAAPGLAKAAPRAAADAADSDRRTG